MTLIIKIYDRSHVNQGLTLNRGSFVKLSTY
jgi:hypothetical protein